MDEVQGGDYVASQVGCAVAKIDPDEVQRTLELLTLAGGVLQ